MKELTKKQTDEIFNANTSNGCREMEENRFHQAVNEAINLAGIPKSWEDILDRLYHGYQLPFKFEK
jgi:hypothetical protein